MCADTLGKQATGGDRGARMRADRREQQRRGEKKAEMEEGINAVRGKKNKWTGEEEREAER